MNVMNQAVAINYPHIAQWLHKNPSEGSVKDAKDQANTKEHFEWRREGNACCDSRWILGYSALFACMVTWRL